MVKRCTHCRGAGRCPLCRGQGRTGWAGVRCSACGGDGRCPLCNGTGIAFEDWLVERV